MNSFADYLEKDSLPFVKIIKQENGGVSKARNEALKQAKGEYVFFLDSDDELPCNALEILLMKNKENPQADFILGNHITMDQYGTHFSTNGYYEKRKEYTNKLLDWGEWMKYIVAGHGNIWGYLLKRDIIEQLNLRFNEKISLAEDVLFLMKYITGRKGVFLKENTYIYRYARPDSLSNTYRKGERELSGCIEFLHEIKKIESHPLNCNNVDFKESVSILVNFMTRRGLGIICSLPREIRKEKIKKLKKFQITLPLDGVPFFERGIRIAYNYVPFVFCIL